jgi:hypothetical protein
VLLDVSYPEYPMEVKLEKRYPVAASVAQAWAVLSDVRATAACMPGAAISEEVDATHYKGTVKSKISAHLEPCEGGADCVLVGSAVVSVSGKLAQFGSRLLVPVSDAMLGQFADNFRAASAAVPAAPTPDAKFAPGSSDAAPPAPAAPRAAAQAARELNVLALAWTVIKAWFAGLFGKRN